MSELRYQGAILLIADDFKPGDPPPSGYLAWHEWADVQHKAGLRQKECCVCCRWKYPQELSDQVRHYTVLNRYGEPVQKVGVVCIGCAAKAAQQDQGGRDEW